MDFQWAQHSIDRLVQLVRSGRLALPDFQREFVWNPSRVVELLDSVARQWPIGSLLLLRGPQPFATRKIDSGPDISGDELDVYILDGQQRVTSLYHAITDTSAYCYFVNLSFLIEGGGEDYIQWQRRDRFEREYATIEARAQNKIALIKDIWDGERFHSWLAHVPADIDKFDIVNLRESKLGGLRSKVYQVLAIQLEQEIDLEALARIFETLNRTGVRLNAFDLMVAALYPSGFNLRASWMTALDEHPILKVFEADALEVLKLVALIVRSEHGKQAARGVRQGDLLQIDRNLVRETWDLALSAYVNALIWCQTAVGMLTPGIVPSWAMVLVVAGLLHYEFDTLTLRSWWTQRAFDQYFSQAANTRVIADFERLMDSAYREDALVAEQQGYALLAESARRNGLYTRGLAGLLIEAGATDILSGEPLRDSEGIAFRVIDDQGMIRRLTPTDSWNRVVVLSERSDRVLGTSRPISELGESALMALARQGIDNRTLSRGVESIAVLVHRNMAGGKSE